jgi:hypothetical protein
VDTGQSNVEKLHAAGLVNTTSLPGPYHDVVKNLSGDEVNALVSIKQRLDKAEQDHKSEAGDEATSVTECFIPL